MENKAKQEKTCKFCAATLILAVAWLLGGLGFFLRALDKVLTGHGLDYYSTYWGVQFNYIGALIVFICGAAVIVISPVIYWFGTMEERSFKKKYGIHDK